MAAIPKAGEFWKDSLGKRAIVHGVTKSLQVLFEYANGSGACFGVSQFQMYWAHLPWCTSFDCPEPVAELWPKFVFGDLWRTSVVAYLRRDSEIATTYVRVDGTEEPYGYQDYLVQKLKSGEWRYITESEALARLTPKCPDCGEIAGDGHADVCPMAWVVQDRVPPREAFDQRRWVHPFSNKPSEWGVPIGLWSLRHGGKNNNGTLEVRCRRKDIPPLPEAVKETRQRIRLWITDDSPPRSVLSSAEKPSSLHRELKHDADGFYIEATE